MLGWQVLAVLGLGLLAFGVGYWLAFRRSRIEAALGMAGVEGRVEADRERLRGTLARVQAELDAARSRLGSAALDQERLAAERAHWEAENRELSQMVLDFGAAQSRRETEMRRLREELSRAQTAQPELEVERKVRRSVERAEREARASLQHTARELGEARQQLAAERLERARSEQARDAAQANVLTLKAEQARLNEALGQATTRLRTAAGATEQLSFMKTENARLRDELNALTAVPSARAGGADIYREELEVRLETAVAHMQRARREAESLSAEAEELRAEVQGLRAELAAAEEGVVERRRLAAEYQSLLDRQQAAESELGSAHARLHEALSSAKRSEARAHAAEVRTTEAARALAQAELEATQLRQRMQSLSARLDELVEVREQNRVLLAQEGRQRELEQRCAGLQTELRNARVAAEKAEAQLRELPAFKEEIKLLREEQRSHLQAEERLLSAEGELRTLKLELESAHAKLRDLGHLRDDHVALREEHQQLAAVDRELAQAHSQVQKLRLELDTREARVQEAARIAEENRGLRDELEELRGLKSTALELDQLRAEHKRLRLDWELAAARIAELEHERTELVELRGRLGELEGIAAEVGELRARERSLEAQLYAMGQIPQSSSLLKAEVTSAPTPRGTAAADMDTWLAQLVQQGLRSAVLADAQGLPVASIGDTLTEEGLAAFSALSSELSARVRVHLPLGPVQLVRILDENQVSVVCRLFHAAGEEYGLSSIGPREAASADTQSIIAGLTSAISAGRHDGDEPVG